MFNIFRKKNGNENNDQWKKGKLVHTEQFEFRIVVKHKDYKFSKNESEFLLSIIKDLTCEKVENPYQED